MKLYIIGNGFDLNHNLKTSYWNYRGFLLRKHPDIIGAFESSQYLEASYCTPDTRWTNLEFNLKISVEECMEYLSTNFYPDMNSERTPGWDDINLEVDNIFSFFSSFTNDCFYEWIGEVGIPHQSYIRTDVDRSAFFVTFNYTKTLEDLYQIPNNNILHIHGSVDDYSTIQFGTPDNHPGMVSQLLENIYSKDDFYNVTFAPAIRNLSGFANIAYKNLNNNYNKLSMFLYSMGRTDEIVIMGHSYLGIDEPYYRDILVPAFINLKWTIYVFDEEDLFLANQFIFKYGLRNVRLICWNGKTLFSSV